MSEQSEHRAKLKEQKALFAKTGIPEELKGHKWERINSSLTVCKECGLVKGSGFFKCEKPKPEKGEPSE